MYLYHNDTEAIENLLMGKRVVSAEGDTLTLDDGTEIEVIPNEGGCSCGAGDYELESIAKVDNIITDVKFDYDPSDDYSDGDGYRIFVFADNEQINLLSVVGDDGNGYYGTGFSLHVKVPEKS